MVARRFHMFCERDHFTPGRRVADSSVERIGSIFGESNDVRPRLTSRELPVQTGDPGADEDDSQPCHHARVETTLEEIEHQRPWRDEKDEDPDRPVIEPVMELVAVPDLAFGIELDEERVRLCPGFSGHPGG